MLESSTMEMALKIILAAVLGMTIGAEREHRHKSAGLRTYTLVAIGSTLFTILSLYGFGGESYRAFDPSRIASQIVVGIGFIGGGMIILRENKVEGLTTAAGIWTTAAIGMAIGLGFYIVAIFATALILMVFVILSQLKKEVFPNDEGRT